jgi:hypothetical protein
MSPACFARVTGKNAVLDRIVRHGDPLAIHEHLDPGRGHAVWRGSAVPVVAAAPAVPVRQPRVDIVGLQWRRPAHQESQGRQDASRRHAHAAVLGCVRTLMPNRGAKRRERTGGIRSERDRRTEPGPLVSSRVMEGRMPPALSAPGRSTPRLRGRFGSDCVGRPNVPAPQCHRTTGQTFRFVIQHTRRARRLPARRCRGRQPTLGFLRVPSTGRFPARSRPGGLSDSR